MRAAATASRLATFATPLLGIVAAGLAALILLFLPEARAAVSTWNASTAYGHCYLVLPMALYLAWDRRDALAGLTARPTPAYALLVVPVTLVWFLADRLGIMEGRQLMAIAAVEVLLLAVMGRALFMALLGPLLFLVFLVPFGAFLTPTLQHITARVTIAGLNLLGIPNISDELTIETPAGTFYVAEACAGLRFLIAAIAFGVFYALLNYRSPGRRVAFIAASIVIPVFANGIRALGIVVLGQILGSAEAAAADHIIYGWVFFSMVLMLLVLAGLPLREGPAVPVGRPAFAAAPSGVAALWGTLAVVLLVAAGPAAARLLDQQARPAPFASLPVLILPEGCEQIGPPPVLPATQAGITLTCDGLPLHVVVQSFPARSTAAAVSARRRLLTGETKAEEIDVTPLPTAEGSWQLVITTQPYRTTAVGTWVDGAPAQGGLAGRLRQARDSILGSSHAVMLIAIGTAPDGRPSPDRERQTIEVLRRLIDAQPSLTQQIEAIARKAA